MTGEPAAADDVTQEVFLAVMRDAGRYERGRSTVVAWLCGIARNHARRRLERDKRLVAFDVDDDDAPIGNRAVTADPLADLTKAEGIEALRRAVVEPAGAHTARRWSLCDLQELSYARGRRGAWVRGRHGAVAAASRARPPGLEARCDGSRHGSGAG